jgi:hypothetical protein
MLSNPVNPYNPLEAKVFLQKTLASNLVQNFLIGEGIINKKNLVPYFLKLHY